MLDYLGIMIQILMNEIIQFNNDKDIYQELCHTQKMSKEGDEREEDAVITTLIVSMLIIDYYQNEYEHDGISCQYPKEMNELHSQLSSIEFQYKTVFMIGQNH